MLNARAFIKVGAGVVSLTAGTVAAAWFASAQVQAQAAPPVRFAEHTIMQAIPGGYQVVAVDLNPGKVVLFGLRPQHRAQTHTTFPMLFNALYLSARGDAPPAKPTN